MPIFASHCIVVKFRDSIAIMAIRSNIESGPAGRAVAANVATLRARRNLDQRGLARRTADLGRALSVSTISRIEQGDRRVDADDLVVLAMALGCTPNALLLPPVTPLGPAGADLYELTPGEQPPRRYTANVLWSWATGEQPLGSAEAGEVFSFIRENRPHHYADHYGPILLKDETRFRVYKTLAGGVRDAVAEGLTMSDIRSLAEIAIDSEVFNTEPGMQAGPGGKRR